jgi:hypothetical protein
LTPFIVFSIPCARITLPSFSEQAPARLTSSKRIERGIILIFIPLLTLSADVMSKFTCANQNFGAVTVQHLDELFDANKQVYYDLLERCHGLRRSTTTTVFIFMSPQFLKITPRHAKCLSSVLIALHFV